MQELELSASRARDRAERIRTALNVSWQLVKDAYVDRDWLALGYASWDEYCTGEFSEFRIKLPREERQEVVSSMREIGMSYRAIGAAMGIDPMTARADVRGVENSTPESGPAPVTGTDGKTYTPKPRPEPEEEPATPEWEEVGTIPTSRLDDLAPKRTSPPIISPEHLDQLNQPTEDQPGDKPRAEPLTNRFTSAIVDLNRVMAKFDRLKNDPNFERNKEKVATLHRHDLNRVISELQDLANQLN